MQLEPDVFNRVFPVVGMTVYPKGNVELIRESKITSDIERGTRDKVHVFSNASRTRLALVAKETTVQFLTFITLTYGVQFPHHGWEVKRDLQRWLGHMVREFGKFDFLWFYEFQKRGAPHIHLFTTLGPPTRDQRRIMSTIWTDFVQDLVERPYSRLKDKKVLTLREASWRFHCRKRQWEAITHPNGAANYATKYSLKMRQKKPPKWFGDVGRFWGHSARVGVISGTEYKMDETSVRAILKHHADRISDWEVLPRILYDVFPDQSLTTDLK